MRTWNMFNNITGIFSGISFTGDKIHLENNTPTDHTPIESEKDVDPRLHILNISSMELDKYIPDKPDTTLEFDWAWNTILKRWDSVPTLYGLRQIKLRELKQQFDVLNNLNIVFDDKEFQADEKSKEALFKQYQLSLSNTDFQVNWILANNTLYSLDSKSIKELVRLIDYRTQTLISKLHKLRSTVETATSDELSSIKLET